MSFWKGLARGFADADAKKERESVRDEAEAARQENLAYGRGRDKVMDDRYATQTATAAAAAEEATRRWEKTYNQSETTLRENRAWRTSEAERAQSNIDRTFDRDEIYANRAWTHSMDQWKFTKDQAAAAKEHSDKVFNQTITAYDYSKSRDVVTDQRNDRIEARVIANELYQKERDVVGDTAATQNRLDRMDEFNRTMKANRERYKISDDQWQKGFDIQQDQIEITRTTALLNAMPASLSSALGGTGNGTTKGAVLSVDTINDGASQFSAEFKNLDEDTRNSEFFKAVSDSLSAQATIMGFLEAQAKKNNIIQLQDVPKYFKYLGATEGKGEAAAKEFMESMLSGDPKVVEKDTFIKGLIAFKNYKATQHLFRQVASPQDITDASKQVSFWETAVEHDGYRAMAGLEGEPRKEVQLALNQLRRKEDRAQGINTLARYGFGVNAVKEFNMVDNPVIKGYYGGTIPDATPTQPIPDQPVTPPVDSGIRYFRDWPEVEAARDGGFSGQVNVNGVIRYVEPLEVLTGDLDTAVVTELTGEPEVFLGGGKLERPALEDDTTIDAMFAEEAPSPLADVTAEADANALRTPQVIDEIPDVDMKSSVTDLEKAAANYKPLDGTETRAAELRSQQAVTSVMSELEEMGIEIPTNREELGWFKDDLKSLVQDFGADVPDDVMRIIIQTATENATKGEVMQDQNNPPADEGQTEGEFMDAANGDRARLERAMKAKDYDEIARLYKKYGMATVTKAMGLN